MAIRDRIKETMGDFAGKTGSRGRTAPAGGTGGTGGAGFGGMLEDLLSFAGDLRGQASGRAQSFFGGELERLAAKLDLVTRREFEAVRAIAIAARTQAQRLEERLEAQLNGGRKQATKPSAKSAAKKTTARAPAAKKAPAKKAPAKTVASRTAKKR